MRQFFNKFLKRDFLMKNFILMCSYGVVQLPKMLDIIAVYKIMRKILNGVMLLLLSITREKSKYFSNILETNQKHECLIFQ